jgi:CheY-like chemotaxis protein
VTRKVLILEDESTIRLTLSYLFRKAGYSVTACTSGSEAIALARTGAYFVVLTDLVLDAKGKLDGLDALQTIKRESPACRVIAITAYGSSDIKREALARGADGYWEKPLDVERLLREIQNLDFTT